MGPIKTFWKYWDASIRRHRENRATHYLMVVMIIVLSLMGMAYPLFLIPLFFAVWILLYMGVYRTGKTQLEIERKQQNSVMPP